MSIWSFKINRDPYGRPIKHKSHLCVHERIQKWGMTYSPVFNWMSVRAMLTIGILVEIYTNSVDFVLAYTQADLKTKYIHGTHHRFWS